MATMVRPPTALLVVLILYVSTISTSRCNSKSNNLHLNLDANVNSDSNGNGNGNGIANRRRNTPAAVVNAFSTFLHSTSAPRYFNCKHHNVISMMSLSRDCEQGGASVTNEVLKTTTPSTETTKKKKKSKFSQLMSGEQIPSSADIDSRMINYRSWNNRKKAASGELGNENRNSEEEVGQEKGSWSIQWKKKGVFNKKLQAVSASTTTPNTDKDIEFYSCTLPDDEIKHHSWDYDDSSSPLSSMGTRGGESLSSTSTEMPDIPPVLHNKREIYHIPSFLSKEQVSKILHLVKLHIQKERQQQEQELDQLSSSSQCFVAIEDGLPQYEHCDNNYVDSTDSKMSVSASNGDNENTLISFLLPILTEQVIPISRELCNAPNIVISDALIRWYGVDTTCAKESSSSVVEALAPHYDVSSYASMIIPLNPEECEGGLYVQYGASSYTRHDVSSSFTNVPQGSDPTLGGTSGDAVLHRYDVMHGVQFKGGPRYSLVIWMTEDLNSCSSGCAPWIAREADCGMSVHAAFLQGLYSKDGLYGVTKNMDAAIHYWEWAAERGHGLSQYSLSMLLIKLGRCESVREQKKIVALLEESAGTGLDLAQHELATMYKQGYYGLKKNEETAIFWYSRGAEQGYKRSIENLIRYQERG